MIRFIEKLGAISTIGVNIRRDVASHGILVFKNGKCVTEKFLDDNKVYLTIRIESAACSGTTETMHVDTALLQNNDPKEVLMNAREAFVEYCLLEIKNDFCEYLSLVAKDLHTSFPIVLGEKK